MSFEDDLSALNQAYFFKEFTYSNSTFRVPEGERELADSLLWLGDSLIIYQIKERAAPDAPTPETEQRWYEEKVLGKGTRQVRDSLRYIREHAAITVQNHRNHDFELSPSKIIKTQKLVVFKPHAILPKLSVMKKFHLSETAGVIHLIPAENYEGIIKTLLTPAEFMDYLEYREMLVNKWGDYLDTLPEQALVGHYVGGNEEVRPEILDAAYLEAIEHELEQWDISGIINLFADRIISENSSTEYYAFVSTLAKLKRNELKEFKLRYSLSIERAKANKPTVPTRVAYPRINCGFVFIPLTDKTIPHRRAALENFTDAHKYDQKLSQCIGITFARDGDKHFTVEWCYMEFPWEHDEDFQKLLEEHNPFREVKAVDLPQFKLRDSEGDDV